MIDSINSECPLSAINPERLHCPTVTHRRSLRFRCQRTTSEKTWEGSCLDVFLQYTTFLAYDDTVEKALFWSTSCVILRRAFRQHTWCTHVLAHQLYQGTSFWHSTSRVEATASLALAVGWAREAGAPLDYRFGLLFFAPF